ncbi:hypothetical protein [Arthrobacter sp. Edens01]|uniref:hypothetical protein n=1 Tax=Arthrobacter sp. Edens01 TaxID=1732020 RepID=UPI0006D9650C|nr:hypothetical protein [Arthrobacter sp. Edens01]KPN18100.1 hypothetical protein AO716_09385 [Arthrobacter sp. Edens01]
MSTAVVPAQPRTGTSLAGHNRISTQALTSTAQAVSAEHFGIPASAVRVTWSDDQGLLALSLALPVTMPPLSAVVKDPGLVERTGGSVWDRVHASKPALLERITYLTGSILSLVDIRVTGIRVQEGARVK